MREWMTSFEKAKRLMLQTEQLDFKNAPTTLSSLTVAESESPTALLDNITKSKPTTQVDELPVVSVNNTSLSESTTTTEKKNHRPSIVMLSTSPEDEQQQSLSHPTSLTPLLVWEASRASMSDNSMPTSTPSSPATQSFSASISLDAALSNSERDDPSNSLGPTTNNTTVTNTSSSSWGIPWALVPSMFQGGSTDDIAPELPSASGTSPNVPAVTDADGHQVIWPTRVDDSNVPKVDLVGYPVWLDARNRELRHLFGGVGPNEVVLSGRMQHMFRNIVFLINAYIYFSFYWFIEKETFT